MTTEVALSVAALLISALSAIYARWSVGEAKRANRISSHSHRLAIFEAVRSFQAGFQVDGEALDASHFYSLLGASGNARLYFTQPTADHLSRYATAAVNVLVARDGARRFEAVGREVPGDKWDEIFRLVDTCRGAEGDLLQNLERETQIAT